MLAIPSTSVEYLSVPVTGALGTEPVEMAVVAAGGEPVEADWKAAAWADGEVRILIGPGTLLPLDEGDYGVWVRIDSPPEAPVLLAGRIKVT